MKRLRNKVAFASIIAGISAAVILIAVVKPHHDETNNAASSLAKNVLTNLSATRSVLTNLATQAVPVDTSAFTSPLRQTFGECIRLAQLLQQQGGARERDWGRSIDRK